MNLLSANVSSVLRRRLQQLTTSKQPDYRPVLGAYGTVKVTLQLGFAP